MVINILVKPTQFEVGALNSEHFTSTVKILNKCELLLSFPRTNHFTVDPILSFY